MGFTSSFTHRDWRDRDLAGPRKEAADEVVSPAAAQIALAVLGLAGLMPAPAGTAQPGTSETPTILTARVDGPITPVVADYLTEGAGSRSPTTPNPMCCG
ncbi:MAG: hypothetical protein ACT4NP_17000 [Pseudonocardiales bacterium]